MKNFELILLAVPAIILLGYLYFLKETWEASGPVWTVGGLLFILGVNFVSWWRVRKKLRG